MCSSNHVPGGSHTSMCVSPHGPSSGTEPRGDAQSAGAVTGAMSSASPSMYCRVEGVMPSAASIEAG